MKRFLILALMGLLLSGCMPVRTAVETTAPATIPETSTTIPTTLPETVPTETETTAPPPPVVELTEEEQDYYRRGKNSHVHGVPKGATPAEYAKATGLEALFGALYLSGQTERLNELFHLLMDEELA